MAGRRYNKGKTRYELISAEALKGLADVYTRGAHKYTIYKDKGGKEVLGKDVPLSEVGEYEIIDDGADNWRKGMSWMSVMGCAKRHIEAFLQGEDIDPDLGTYHLDNAMWNLATLRDYYKTHPEYDDRPRKPRKRIGLDIDEVLCDWINDWRKLYNIKDVPTSWFFDRSISARFDQMKKAGTLESFYASLKPLLKPEDIPFEPCCYITSRPCSVETTISWLDRNGFPTKPVHCVGVGQSKVDVAKQAGVEVFVDDSYDNYVALNEAGIVCYLYDAPHNRRYDVGYKRIYSLKELA